MKIMASQIEKEKGMSFETTFICKMKKNISM